MSKRKLQNRSCKSYIFLLPADIYVQQKNNGLKQTLRKGRVELNCVSEQRILFFSHVDW